MYYVRQNLSVTIRITEAFKPTCFTPVAGVSGRACAVVPVDSVNTCRPIHAWVTVTFINV